MGDADAESIPFTDLHRSSGEGVKKRRGLRVMKRVKKGRHLTDGKNTSQEPRQLEDQESEEDDADLMGLTREEVEDIYHHPAIRRLKRYLQADG